MKNHLLSRIIVRPIFLLLILTNFPKSQGQDVLTEEERRALGLEVDALSPSESVNKPLPQVLKEVVDEGLDEESRERQAEIESALEGPRQIPRDHIFVIQRRSIKKSMRLEISPLAVGVQVSDSFRKQFLWNAGMGIHLTESLGWEILQASFLNNFDSGLNASLQSNFGLSTFREEPRMSFSSSLLWTPFLSKAAGLRTIRFFEGYFILGGGWVRYETQGFGMANFGFGFRHYSSRDSFFKVEFRDAIDFQNGRYHRMNVLVGWSRLLGDPQ